MTTTLGCSARKRVRKRARGRACPYCDRLMDGDYGNGLAATVDHILPRARGGTNVRANCVACCFRCNNDKGDMRLGEWAAWLRHTDDPRFRHVVAFMAKLDTAAQQDFDSAPLAPKNHTPKITPPGVVDNSSPSGHYRVQ